MRDCWQWVLLVLIKSTLFLAARLSDTIEIFSKQCSKVKTTTTVLSTRNTTTAHISLIRELTFKVWPQTYATIISKKQIEYMLEMMYSETSLQKQMAEGCQFIIVYDEAEPVGFASYQEIEPSIFKLHKIYVLTSQQGKGTGKFLINWILNEIQKKSATSLQLQVNRDNNARVFYEKLDFIVIEEADFGIGNGYFMKDFIMEKKNRANLFSTHFYNQENWLDQPAFQIHTSTILFCPPD